jgi:prepilin-type N-terminal cleavage/methylation domain-containing protein
MKANIHHSRKSSGKLGFTLMETVIAILVLAILLTGFLTVFTPAAQGIKKSISTQQADRLASTLVRDMSRLYEGETNTHPTGFDKAFNWIKNGDQPANAIFVYQYRANRASSPRTDGTLAPMDKIQGKPGIDYIVQSVARRANDTLLAADLEALVGPIFYVKMTQLVVENNQLELGTPGQISNPAGEIPAIANLPADYKDAVITFSTTFHRVPSAAHAYLTGPAFAKKFDSEAKPIFTRNLAVRR